jgi:prepilin-type N-terminal cleavage/methylation domain-containing protein
MEKVLPQTMTSGTGKNQKSKTAAFSLVELLVVVAIIAIMMGILGLSIQGFSSSSLQTAASQVSSGLSLARQIAITKNTRTAFVFATNTNGSGMPPEPYKYWSVIASNRDTGNWDRVKDWESLPEGVVFLQGLHLASSPAYSPLNANPMPNTPAGTPFNPTDFFLPVQTNFQGLPFTPMGSSTNTHNGIRLAQGSVTPDGQVILRNTNNFYFVETGGFSGRIRVRSLESYNP